MNDYAELRAALAQSCHALLIDDPAILRDLLAERDTLAAECQEQARLNGMGAEREARLMAKRDALREALGVARDFVVEALAQERVAYRGHESVSDIADIERYLGQIDAALAQEGA